MSMQRLQFGVSKISVKVVLPLLTVLSLLAGVATPVAADYIPPAPSKITLNFACSDDSTGSTRDKGKNNTAVVRCANKSATIDYLNYSTDHPKYISMAVSCPKGDSALWTPNVVQSGSTGPSYITLSCKTVTGHDSNGTPIYSKSSVATPKIASPQINKGSTTGSLGPGATQSGIDASSLQQVQVDQSTVSNILNIFFGILGGIAVLVVAVGGLRYILANGDPSAIAQAKNTILYALIGLVVAVSGFAIVTFVLRGL